MGRTLEALKQATTPGYPREQGAPLARVPRAVKDAPALQAVWPEDVAQETDVPFVEVGGPRTTPPPPQAAVPPVVPPAPPAPEEPRLMTVLFRPLPDEPATRHGRSRFAPELVAYHQPDHAISGQYRDLLGRMLGTLPGERARVLLFTSASPATGTTTVLLNLAISVARQSGRRVVVVSEAGANSCGRQRHIPDALTFGALKRS